MKYQTFPSTLRALMALLLFIVSVSVLVSQSAAQDTMLCKKPSGQESSSCVCQTEKGDIIDLNSLSNKDGTARFTNLKDTKGYTYGYSPCTTFTDSSNQKHLEKCKDVYICQTSTTDVNTVYTVGQTLDTNIYLNSTKKQYYLQYVGPAGQRHTKVYLNCDQSTEGKVTSVTQTSDGTATNYVFQLNTCYACPGGCHHGKSGVAPGYIGIVFLILILAAIVTYCIVGGILMKVHRQATGTDIIPNKTIWVQMPLLVKDGVLFTISPVMKLARSGKNDYQKI